MDRRPPLVLSPRRLRPRRALPPRHPAPPPPAKSSPVTNSKATHPLRASVSGASLFRSEPDLISSELLAIANNAKEEEFKENLYQENEKENKKLFSPNTPVARKSSTNSPLFERGRLYDLYSARRNERLRRRQLELLEETEAVKVIQNPLVAVELAKRKTSKKNESARKSISGDFVSRIPTLRSSVRTSKEMKKSTASLAFDEKSSVGSSVRRIGTRSAARRL